METKKYTVYSISLNGEVKYVGKTCDFDRRKREHLKKRGSSMSAIPVDIDLGLITFTILAEADDRDTALKLEDMYILEYNVIKNGWNKIRSGHVLIDRPIEYNKEKCKRYREEHREEHNRRNCEWAKAHRASRCKTLNAWRAKNRAEVNRKQQEYRAKKKAEKLSQPSDS